MALVGSDTFVNQVLRPYVELFSSKPPDWQGFIQFFIIPLGVNSVSKYIGSLDPVYASMFLHESWKELLEMAEPGKAQVGEIVNRVIQYLASGTAENLIQLPVAEAMVTYKEKRYEKNHFSLWPLLQLIQLHAAIVALQNPVVGVQAISSGETPGSDYAANSLLSEAYLLPPHHHHHIFFLAAPTRSQARCSFHSCATSELAPIPI